MTTRRVIELDIFVLAIVSTFIGIFFALYSNNKSNIRTSFLLPAMENFQNPTPLPTQAPPPKIETSSQISPDGTKKLTMTITTNKDNSKTYAFTTSEVEVTNTTEQPLFDTTLSGTESMSIPYNTWSPNNLYVFLQHNTPGNSEAFIMKANGQSLAGDEQYYNVTVLFNAKNTGNTYQETTGWASNTLLIVNTTRPDGSKGPSYWFEVPSKAIIRLSTVF